MSIPYLKPKSASRPPQTDRSQIEALERLYAHFAAVQSAIRALEEYRRLSPGRALRASSVWEKLA